MNHNSLPYDTALRLLKSIEWGPDPVLLSNSCPYCLNYKKEGHDPDCDLGNFLSNQTELKHDVEKELRRLEELEQLWGGDDPVILRARVARAELFAESGVARDLASALRTLLSNPSDDAMDAKWVDDNYQLVPYPSNKCKWFLTPLAIAKHKAKMALASYDIDF